MFSYQKSSARKDWKLFHINEADDSTGPGREIFSSFNMLYVIKQLLINHSDATMSHQYRFRSECLYNTSRFSFQSAYRLLNKRFLNLKWFVIIRKCTYIITFIMLSTVELIYNLYWCKIGLRILFLLIICWIVTRKMPSRDLNTRNNLTLQNQSLLPINSGIVICIKHCTSHQIQFRKLFTSHEITFYYNVVTCMKIGTKIVTISQNSMFMFHADT